MKKTKEEKEFHLVDEKSTNCELYVQKISVWLSKVEKKSDKMFAKLESTDDKKEKLVNEQIDKMKKFIDYDRKTQ